MLGGGAREPNRRPVRLGCVTIVGVTSEGDELELTDVSFEGFFAAHHDAVVRALSLTLGDVDLASDAAAEGFARALQRWPQVAGSANPTGWVYRVGLNWARSRWRKLRRERRGVAIDVASADGAPDDGTMLTALRRLSEDHRSVVVGRYYLDWSEADLADALDIPPGTVKSRLSRALAQLAVLMEDDHGRS